jgi:hypothetical protein
MNIYFDSSIGGSQTLPPNSSFVNLETNELIVHSGIAIDGLNKGSILICENNTNDIGQLLLGPDNYILSSNTTTDLPEWRNYIKSLDYIETNNIKIPSLQQGDILLGLNTQFLGRLPANQPNSYLHSDGGGAVGWQSASFNSQHLAIAGPTSIPQGLPVLVLSSNAFNLVIGRRYKFTVSAKINCNSVVVFNLGFSGVNQVNFGYSYSGDMHRTFLYTSAIDGPLLVELYGNSAGIGDTITDFQIFGENF